MKTNVALSQDICVKMLTELTWQQDAIVRQIRMNTLQYKQHHIYLIVDTIVQRVLCAAYIWYK